MRYNLVLGGIFLLLTLPFTMFRWECSAVVVMILISLLAVLVIMSIIGKKMEFIERLGAYQGFCLTLMAAGALFYIIISGYLVWLLVASVT